MSPFVPRARSKFALLVVTSVVAGVCEAFVLVIVVNAAINVTGGETSSVSSVLSIGFDPKVMLVIAAILAVVVVLMHWIIASVSGVISASVLVGTQEAAIAAFVSARWESQAIEKSGGLAEATSSLAPQAAALSNSLAVWATSLIQLLAIMATALSVNAIATGTVLLFGVAVFAVLRPISAATKRRAAQYVAANGIFMNEVSRLRSIAMEMKVHGVESVAARSLTSAAEAAATSFQSARILARFGSTLYRDFAVILMIGAVGVLGAVSTAAIAGIGAVVILVIRAVGSAQGVYATQQQVYEYRPHLDELKAHIARLSRDVDSFGSRVVGRIESISVSGVSYSYVEGVLAIDEVDLSVGPGEVIGVVGPSGGGKSTLMQVLLRLRLPSSGEVLVNGFPYEAIDAAAWAELIAFVPQEPQMMEGTIAENIVFFRDGFTMAQVERAADAAHVGAEVRLMQGGFEKRLGPDGKGLSGGQKQRVAIARALLGSPSLLVLDEPTSALDGVSERLMQQTIAELKSRISTVVVAHRLTTLDSCDRILVLQKGRVVATGSPAELAQREGFFRDALDMR